MEWQPLLVAPGPLLSSPHTSWHIWSGGAPTLMDVASSRIAAGGAGAATRTRGQTIGATLPATDASSGCWQNQPAMERARGTRLSLAKGFRLRGIEARWGAVSYRWKVGKGTRRRARREP